ncbi:MAG: hypothetical protein Q7T36_15150 [Fluviicoccus sp.]|uniref:DUF6160 family protein n=1 Tax=Fluviicoccus sp. TaxID=2003552 RepID=UPI00271AA9C2|nr:DUF6160 family protein [Fluviicoccus sp.]MDO8331801.1 hypothetical protein [Fluviicoccus sp.]
MTHFNRLLLASLIATSSSAFALESLEDEALSQTSGQDGVTISITPPVAGIVFSTVIHDSDPAVDGAIIIGNPLSAAGHTATSITTPVGQSINLVVDATGDVDAGTAGNQASLLVNVVIPTGTIIHTGSISAAQSNLAGVAVTNQTAAIVDDITVTLGATTLAMTLGNEVATTGQMMRFTSLMTGGLTLANFALRDANGGNGSAASGGSAIRATSIVMNDLGASTDLNIDARIDVVPTGLQVNLVQFGTLAGGADVQLTGLRFGSTSAVDNVAIGNVDIVGLNLAGTLIKIAGH